jgi:large subunit ribosomal protein L13
MEKIIINGDYGTFGRICSLAAKSALEGKEVAVVNSEKVVITGNKKDIIQRYRTLKAKGGHSQRGPKVLRAPHRILKRGIRGMLPDHRKGLGKQAFLRIKCYEGVPKEFEGKEMIKVNGPRHGRFIELKELSEKI